MLILEGTDGVGKTTLCKKLLDKFAGSYTYRHLSKLPLSWMFPGSYYPHISRYVVQDRFHMSELAYRYARDEPQVLTIEAYRYIDGWVRSVGGLTVVFTADEGWLTSRPKREEMHTAVQHMRADLAFRDIASQMFAGYQCDVDLHFHLTDYPSDWMIKIIEEHYYARQEALSEVGRQVHYLHGHHLPPRYPEHV